MKNLKKKLKRQSTKQKRKQSISRELTHSLRNLLIEYFKRHELPLKEIKKTKLDLDYLEHCHPSLYKKFSKKDNRTKLIIQNKLDSIILDDIINIIENLTYKPLNDTLNLFLDTMLNQLRKKEINIDINNQITKLLNTSPKQISI